MNYVGINIHKRQSVCATQGACAAASNDCQKGRVAL